jgi:hypothetical protein
MKNILIPKQGRLPRDDRQWYAYHRLKNTDLDDSHASKRWLIDIVSN